MSKETKKISLSVLTEQVNSGMKKVELAAFYDLPMMQMTKVLQSAGLKIRKFHTPAFILENDLETSQESATLEPTFPFAEEETSTETSSVNDELPAPEEVAEESAPEEEVEEVEAEEVEVRKPRTLSDLLR